MREAYIQDMKSSTDLRSPAAEIANRKRQLRDLEARITDSADNGVARPELEQRAAELRDNLRKWTCPSYDVDGRDANPYCPICGKKIGFTGYTKKYGAGGRRRHYTARFIAIAAREAQRADH